MEEVGQRQEQLPRTHPRERVQHRLPPVPGDWVSAYWLQTDARGGFVKLRLRRSPRLLWIQDGDVSWRPDAASMERTASNGTQTLIAAINVATGKIAPHCVDTRTGADFCGFIKGLVEKNPGFQRYHFVCDQLNTHKSESLVRYVDYYCGLDLELGVKGRNGILKSMQSREEFSDSNGLWSTNELITKSVCL
jgi:hypothetical protein